MRRFILIMLLFIAGCAQNTRLPPIVDQSLPSRAYKNQYVVHRGDTLYSIAFANDLDYRQLADANGLKPPYSLHTGQTLRVRKPPSKKAKLARVWVASEAARFAKTKKISSLKSKGNEANLIKDSRQHAQVQEAQPVRVSAVPTPVKNRQKYHEKTPEKGTPAKNISKIQQKDLKSEENCVQCWSWPIRGKVIGHFSPGQLGNKGIDIAGQLGQPVQAAAQGTVVYSGSGLRGYGNLIIIKHNSRFLSAYAYNYKLKVREGERVEAGQEIATVGRATSGKLMLHFEIRCDGLPVNPIQYLR